MTGVVDYAGLFPPAALAMRESLQNYAAASVGADAWLLGRFVVPASRLTELVEHAGVLGPARLPLSVIVTDGATAEIEAIAALGGRPGAGQGGIVVECLECKPRSLDSIEWLSRASNGAFEVYVEIDPSADLATWMPRLAASGLRAKLRTGSTTAAAFPSPATVAAFMAAAISTGVPFKATAGLHHAVRGRYRLTYEPDSAEAVMHGYLNVLLAAAALRNGHAAQIAERVLEETNLSSMTVSADAIQWAGLTWSAADLRGLRLEGLVGFGSCSIAEPASDIRALVRRNS